MPIQPRLRASAFAAAITVVGALVPLAMPAPASGAGLPDGDQPADFAAADSAPDFETVAGLDELTGDHARLFRLYHAFFDRPPDADGAIYWIEQQESCVGLDRIAELFADGVEFDRRYGPLDDLGFVEQIYRNVLGRPAEPAGADYWTGLLTRGRLTRGGVVLNVSFSAEFGRRHPYPSDDVPARSCRGLDGAPADRSVHLLVEPASRPLATVAGLTLSSPAVIIERAGFHQSSHPGALAMAAPDPVAVRTTVMASRRRGTDRQGAVDVATEPTVDILAPISGTVARAGNYTLYCRHSDGFVVINPDDRPDLEVKLLHIQGVRVRQGDRVEAGQPVADNATPLPFQSQIDRLTGEPSWPHVHIEVVDPSIPRRPSSGRC